jgi:hypothetical protein
VFFRLEIALVAVQYLKKYSNMAILVKGGAGVCVCVCVHARTQIFNPYGLVQAAQLFVCIASAEIMLIIASVRV